jgi:hypothetical protein
MAKLSDAAQLDIANKLSLGIASTNTDKNYFEEEYGWLPTVRNSDIYAEDVPFAADPTAADTAAADTAGVVTKYTDALMDEVPLSNGQAYAVFQTPGDTSSTRIIDWLTPQIFGSGYFFTLKENDDTVINLTDGRYQVDNRNGIVRFDEGFTPSDLGLTTPLKITFYQYSGMKGGVGGGGGDLTAGEVVPRQEIITITTAVGPTDGDTVVGQASFAVSNADGFRLYLNKLFLVQGQDYELVGVDLNQINWLISSHGVSLDPSEDQLVALYNEDIEFLPVQTPVTAIPRQQELTSQNISITDGDVTLTDMLDTPVNNPNSVRIFLNKLYQVQGPGRDYDLTGPGYRSIIWQRGTGTASDMLDTDELVALFLQDADTAVGATGATGAVGPTGPAGGGGGGGGVMRQEILGSETITDVDQALSTQLIFTPTSDEGVQLSLNGVIQRQGFDFEISATDPQTIIWLAGTGTAANINTLDVLIAYYPSIEAT